MHFSAFIIYNIMIALLNFYTFNDRVDCCVFSVNIEPTVFSHCFNIPNALQIFFAAKIAAFFLLFTCTNFGSRCVTVSEKTDHLAQILDIEILVPSCSALLTLRNGEVRIAIAYTILE